tara:strand:+ start:1877 stop:2014 length:138 start_codon:yes stop_codon:yes gene_type:complete
MILKPRDKFKNSFYELEKDFSHILKNHVYKKEITIDFSKDYVTIA